MASAMTTTTPQKHKPFPLVVSNGHRGEHSDHSPNPDHHPYAIRTTSSALLTRSNSTSFGANNHAYIPSSPSPNAKHRYTKSDVEKRSSMVITAPRPLPIPPSLESPSKTSHDEYSSSEDIRPVSWRTRRADTLPSIPPPTSPVKLDDLPSNPKVWTTSQLSSYLITALRVRSGESLPVPVPVARDIALFVKEARLNGRAFLRLTEEDLELMEVNNLWASAILGASRNLRQNVVKGKIWGFDSNGEDGGLDAETNSAVARERRPPFSYKPDNSSSSSVDLPGSADVTPNRRRGHGRVRGMIASFEHTESPGSHGGSTSEGSVIRDALWVDEEPSTSGSEASEADDEGIDSSPPATTSRALPVIPVTPPMDLLQEIPGDAAVKIIQADDASDRELSVHELLASEGTTQSWGAKAWEDMDVNAGITVKRLVSETPEPDQDNTTPVRKAVVSRPGSEGKRKEDRAQAKDIFSRPLPLPPSPVSDAGTQDPSESNIKGAANVVQREEISDNERHLTKTRDVEQQTDESSFTVLSERETLYRDRQRALELVDELNARLSEAEKRLEAMQMQAPKHTEVVAIEYRSCAVETIITPATIHNEDSPSSPRVESSTSPQTNEHHEAASQGTSLSPEGTLDINNSSPSSQIFGRSDWRNMMPGKDWDPLENGLSSYVLMVGVGVCAVVLQTLLKRLAGRKA